MSKKSQRRSRLATLKVLAMLAAPVKSK